MKARKESLKEDDGTALGPAARSLAWQSGDGTSSCIIDSAPSGVAVWPCNY